MKVLFVGRSVYHFSYYESLLRALCEQGHQVDAVFDEQWSNAKPQSALLRFSSEGRRFSWRWGKRRSGMLRKLLFNMREIRSYVSYLKRSNQSDFYLNRWKSYLPRPIRRGVDNPIVKSFLKSSLVEQLLPFIEEICPPEKTILDDIRQINPDLIIASPANMRFSEEVEYVKAGRSLGIPTAIIVLSWDNLTTKGLFHVHPDLVLCWNSSHVDEAIQIHQISKENVLPIGATFFDKWFDTQRFDLAKEEFYSRVGLRRGYPFFLYLGSSANIAEDESWLVEELNNAIRLHPGMNMRNAQLLIRPHPANAKNYCKLDGQENLVIWPKLGALPESDDSQIEFVNSVRHSVATVGINTTGMMDAIILGRPCITIMADRYQKTQSEASHFRHLFDSGALEIATDGKSCATILNKLLEGKDETLEAREAFVRKFVRPYGLTKSAGKVGGLALELLGDAKRWTKAVNVTFFEKAGEKE